MSMLSQSILDAARSVPSARLAFGHKAFLHDVHAYMPCQHRISLDAFKQAVVNDADCRGIMSRLDMVQLFPQADVQASNADYVVGGRAVATYNFVRLPSAW